jgi:hypothetical protein
MELRRNTGYFSKQHYVIGFIMETVHAYCAVRTESVNTIQVSFVFKVLTFILVTVYITICRI